MILTPGTVMNLALCQTSVQERVAEVGEIIRNKRHWALLGNVRVAVPYLVDSTPDSVDIAIARTREGRHVTIRLGAEFFESASTSKIEAWVDEENRNKTESIQNSIEEQQNAQRNREISILQELIQRYPAEADILSAGMSADSEPVN